MTSHESSNSKIRKNPIFDAVDRMPFSGKFIVKDKYVGFDTASDERKKKTAMGAAALIGFSTLAHASQAYLGIGAFMTHSQGALEGDVSDIIFAGVDAMYVAGMSAVTARHAALTTKIASKYMKWKREKDIVPEENRRKEMRPYSHRAAALFGALAFTLSAQAVELYSIVDAANQRANSATSVHYEQPR